MGERGQWMVWDGVLLKNRQGLLVTLLFFSFKQIFDLNFYFTIMPCYVCDLGEIC